MRFDLDLTLPERVGLATYPSGATFGPRQMRDYEFVWMVEGDAQYRWGEQTVEAPEGSFVLCRPGQTDYFRWDPRRRTRHGFIHFMIGRIPPDWPAPETWPLVRAPLEGDLCWALVRHLGAYVEDGDRRSVELSVIQLLWAFVSGERATAAEPQLKYPDPVERTLAFIREALDKNSARKLALGELARAAAVTPEHLCRLFVEATGCTPVQTVRLARLDRAATLLSRTNFTLQQIAEQCGFASPFHFSRTFKAVYGKPPSQVRAEVEAGATPPLPRLLRFRDKVARPISISGMK
ncbi:MAG: hypothetical protein AMXMBFR7_37910 [Planctomycetota bacterium]